MIRAALLLATLPAAFSASVPDWVKAAAAAPVSRIDSPEAPAVILVDDRAVSISSRTETTEARRFAIRLMSNNAGDRRSHLVYVNHVLKLNKLRGWCITPAGEEIELGERDAVQLSMEASVLYSDSKSLVLTLPCDSVGSVVAFETEVRSRADLLSVYWSFQQDLPVRTASFRLRLPAGWEFEPRWLNHRGIVPSRLPDNGWLWTLSSVRAVETEPSMPSWRAVAGSLSLAFFPDSQAKNAYRAKPAVSWTELGRYYQSLAGTRAEPDAAIRAKAAELTAGKETVRDKVAALARFAQSEIRYVAIAIGIGAIQPHAAPEVLSARYGDCKDKATLLIALLKAIGIEGYFVLIHSDRGFTRPEAPGFAFNHAIVAIRADEKLRAELPQAIAEAPGIGPVAFFDPTDEHTPFGYLPTNEQGSLALLIAPTGGLPVTIPAAAPPYNNLSRIVNATLDERGQLAAKVTERRDGAFATSLERQWSTSGTNERIGLFTASIGHTVAAFDLLTYGYDPTLGSAAYSFLAPNYAMWSGTLLPIRVRLLGEKSDLVDDEDKRIHPVEFESTSQETDYFEIAVPPTIELVALPEPVNVDLNFARLTASTEWKEGRLIYRRQLVIRELRVTPEQARELNGLYRRLLADQEAVALFRKKME